MQVSDETFPVSVDIFFPQVFIMKLNFFLD